MKSYIAKAVFTLALSSAATLVFAIKNNIPTTAVRSDREVLRPLDQDLNGLTAKFSAYPNPVLRIVHFEWKDNTISKIEITDMNGKLVGSEFSKFPNSSEIDFDIARLDPGIYFVRAFNVIGNSVTMKIVKK